MVFLANKLDHLLSEGRTAQECGAALSQHAACRTLKLTEQELARITDTIARTLVQLGPDLQPETTRG